MVFAGQSHNMVLCSTDYFTSLLQAEFPAPVHPTVKLNTKLMCFFWDFIDDIEGLYLVI